MVEALIICFVYSVDHSCSEGLIDIFVEFAAKLQPGLLWIAVGF